MMVVESLRSSTISSFGCLSRIFGPPVPRPVPKRGSRLSRRGVPAPRSSSCWQRRRRPPAEPPRRAEQQGGEHLVGGLPCGQRVGRAAHLHLVGVLRYGSCVRVARVDPLILRCIYATGLHQRGV